MRALAVVVALLLGCPAIACADPGGTLIGPGPCDYPGVGGFAQVQVIGGGQGWGCDFPVEENGSVWRCALGYGGLGFSGGGFVGGAIGLPAPLINGGGGACNYVCPDTPWPGYVTYQPNPPGLWKSHLIPHRCAPVQPVRILFEPKAPPLLSPDDGGQPAPVAPPPSPPDQLGPVTNPDNPNPDATQNP